MLRTSRLPCARGHEVSETLCHVPAWKHPAGWRPVLCRRGNSPRPGKLQRGIANSRLGNPHCARVWSCRHYCFTAGLVHNYETAVESKREAVLMQPSIVGPENGATRTAYPARHRPRRTMSATAAWPLPNMRLSGRAVNKVPVVLLRRAAQLWR
jgi:hypothetical protein